MVMRILIVALILSIAGNAVARAMLASGERMVPMEHLLQHHGAGDHHHHDDGSFHNDEPDAAVVHTHVDGAFPATGWSEPPAVPVLAMTPPRPSKLAVQRCPYPVLDGPLRPPRLASQSPPVTRLRV